MKKGLTELVFILDKSGSMSGLEKDTIGGYNSMLAKQKNVQGDCHITTVLFDNNYELLHDRIDIRAVSPITEKEYQVGGSTALLDAIGSTIHKIGNAQKHTAEEYRAENVMFVIITDGEENSSREYSAEKVKSQIERQKSKYNWEFIFLGANIDAVHTAKQFGIGEDRAMDYIADSEGTALNYSVMSDVVSEFREKTTISDKHFDEIRKDAKKAWWTKMKPDEMPSTNISKLWISNNQKDWLDAEDSYWRQVSDANIKLEKELEILEYSIVSQMSTEEFYTFLYDTYFVWKYTAKNRLATIRAQLKRHLTNQKSVLGF